MDMKRIFTVLSCVLLASAAMSAQTWRQYEAAATGLASQDADCVVLLDSTSVSVEPTGQGSFTVYRAFRVQTPEGALANRVIKYDYDPLTAFAEFKYVTIYRSSGEVEHLDVSEALDYAAPARMIYWGARQIMIEIGALEPGDIVEYEIAKKGFTYALLTSGVDAEDDSRFIPPMRGQFYDIVPFWCADPTVRKVYQVSFPMEKDVQFQFYQGECASSMRFEDGRKVYRFAVNDVMPFDSEPNMVDLFDAAPKLMMSTTPDWKEKSLWFNKVNEDYGSFDAYAPAQKKVDELIRGKETEMEKIAVLTHWVADNIRYSGCLQGYRRHPDILPAYGRFRGLSCDDHGRQPCREHSRRPFQSLRSGREAFRRHLHAPRPYLGAFLPRAVEQCGAAAELPARCTRGLGSLPDSGIGAREPLRAHQG